LFEIFIALVSWGGYQRAEYFNVFLLQLGFNSWQSMSVVGGVVCIIRTSMEEKDIRNVGHKEAEKR
jgi:hypothetical protein